MVRRSGFHYPTTPTATVPSTVSTDQAGPTASTNRSQDASRETDIGVTEQTHRHRILALSKGMRRGGAEALLVEQARALRALGHEMDVLYDLEHPGPISHELERIGCSVTGHRGLHRRPGALRRSSNDYCIVHTHSPLPAATARVALRPLKKSSLVHTEHNVWDQYHPLTRLANRITFPLTDAAIAVSLVVKQSMSASAAENATVIHHGIDIDAAMNRADRGRGSLRALIGVDAGVPIIGTIANLRREKDYPNLIRTAVRVRKRIPEAVFVAIGHGPLEAEIRQMVERSELSRSFFLLGNRDDALELISDVDIFVLASRYEGLPVAIMEAMAISRPIVATDAGGVRELIRHDSTGLCVPTADPEALAHAVLALLDDPPRASRLAEVARGVIEHCSPVAVGRQIVDIYNDVCRSEANS